MCTEKSFLSILQSLDAFFPVGAFTLSNGLEDYVMRDRIGSEKELEEYLEGFLVTFPYQDLGMLSLAYRNHSDHEFLCELDGLADAIKNASEVRIGNSRMCSRYLKAREAMHDCVGGVRWYQTQIKNRTLTGFHPIALGIYAAEHAMNQEMLLQMYGYSVISAIVNNAVKLVPLSQMQGQRILFEQLDGLNQMAERAMQVKFEDLGVAGAMNEVHCMNHEKLYSRQYMS